MYNPNKSLEENIWEVATDNIMASRDSYDENFDADAEADFLSDMEQMAQERGFESVEDMQEYDRERDLMWLDYRRAVGA